MKKIFQPILLIQTFLLAGIIGHSQVTYEKQELLITMRDGVKLNTVIFTPKNATENVPFLLSRTPYGVSGSTSPDKNSYIKDMASEGYIFVFQDIRGRYKSEGTFEMQRFTRDKKDPKAIDESTDTWDTIDWLLKNISGHNGKVGMYGISYDGWTTVMGALDPHPALIAVSEQATPADMFLGDDFHHNGAFRLSYGMEYAFMEEAAKTDSLFPGYGYINTDGGLYSNLSHGLLSAQVKYANHYGLCVQGNAGIDAEQVRNEVQNKLIHDMPFVPKKYNKAQNLHIPMVDENGQQYLYKKEQKIKKPKVFLNGSTSPNVFY